MKKLDLPLHDDAAAAHVLSVNHRLKSYPLLSSHLSAITKRYGEYTESAGNPWALGGPLPLPPTLGDAMRAHYDTAPTGLEFIAHMRYKASPDVCPMCGSFGTSTLDHVLPKSVYPEFALFSRNLVPACSCNSLRGERYQGKSGDARTLHPYFDSSLGKRLVYVRFGGNFDNPTTRIEVTHDGIANNIYPSLKFHIDTVLAKTALLVWASKKWAKFQRDPESILFSLPQSELNEHDIRDAIRARCKAVDAEYETSNNWYSMFLWGIQLYEGATAYILRRVNARRSGETEML
ncbi:hypothetical protein FVF58_26930 [Paraburkholderia panacisoli]|uniref:HNH endonuclease n=1 Tax=Paraburkholderia panacisoli TaxID=2603818 RepID=A0A5B0GTG5_9BURK|nr:hypothetical protein [Paraburkholderia panacisoli]KAA1006215.1 hypothetical protein FVF58_26930 [Paraburkholderia panacisoli]